MTNQQVQISDGSVTFEFKIPQKSVETTYQEVLQEFAAKTEIKGFRKGKAPAKLVEQSVDKSKVMDHVLEHVIPPAYEKELKKGGYLPIIEPRITPMAMEDGKDWSFKAETAERPTFMIGDYKKSVQSALREHDKTHKHTDEKGAREHKLSVIFDALLKSITVEIAGILKDAETKGALSKLVNQLSSLQLSLQDYLKSIKKTQEELVKEYETTAVTNLKLEFIISEIAKDLDLKVKESDPYKKYAEERKLTIDFLAEL